MTALYVQFFTRDARNDVNPHNESYATRKTEATLTATLAILFVLLLSSVGYSDRLPLVCAVTTTATPGSCNAATNTYAVSGTISLTADVAGSLTITDGTSTTIVDVATGVSSIDYTLAGLPSGTGSHTVVVSVPSCGTATATYAAPAACFESPCGLAVSVIPGLCDPATNSYVLSGTITATSVPTSGSLTISSGAFSTRVLSLPVGNASGTFSYSGLVSNSQTYTVTASYSDTACSPASQVYTAPASCSIAPPCSISATATAGLCQTATNTYSTTVLVSLSNAPAGTITVDIPGVDPITQVIAANTPSFAVVLGGLISDGTSHTATISLPGCGTTTALFTAPASCSVAPPCSISAVVTAGVCQPVTNAFSTTAVVTIQNPGAGQLTITDGPASLTFATTAVSTATFRAILDGLVADGTVHTLTATLPGCSAISTTYAAPVSCSTAPPCAIDIASATAGLCQTATNTYSSTAVVVLTNVTAGTLTITDGPQTATLVTTAASSATYVVGFPGLVSDGSLHTIRVTLPGCSSAMATYTAPTACSVTPVCSLSASVSVGTCASATNAYSATATIVVLNPTGGSSLSVTIDGRTLVFSTTALSQNTFVATFQGLQSDGAAHLALVTLPGCSTISVPFTAPVSCSVAPVCSLSAVVNTGLCAEATNTYSNTVIVTVTNPTAGTLTVTDGPQSVTFTIPGSLGTLSASAIFNGLLSDGSSHTITVSLPGCSSLTTTYTAPASCTSGAPTYVLAKTVDRSRVDRGGTVTYTVSLTNTGNTTGTNLTITDQFSTSGVSVAGSATTTTGTFNAGTWSIPSLAPGQVAILTISAQLNVEGLIYNTATAPNGVSATVCTTVPYTVCPSSPFQVNLSVAAGQLSYQWTKDGQPITGATSNTLSVTALGEYTLTGSDGCPFVVEAVSPLPSLTAIAVAAGCSDAAPLNDARITLISSSANAVSYNITRGSSFTATTPLFTSNQALALVTESALATGLANPGAVAGQPYTIRVYSADSCFTDTMVLLPFTQCTCTSSSCLPLVVQRIR
ncbi:DUF11 domain-containing protein [Fibrella sp. USSR17]